MASGSEALQLSLGVDAPHNNRFLFSDHYLAHLLPQDGRWQAALGEAQAFLAWLQDLYATEKAHLGSYNESQLEDHWLRPILQELGHTYEGQASVPGLGKGIKRPDYVFFADEAARQAALQAQGTEAYAGEALAVGEVKGWDVALGKKLKGGGPSFDDQNPSYQIDYYLKATGLDWGILSNGRLWRLVHAESSQRLTVYYEVDLVDLLQRGKADEMRYFTLFFRQAAFTSDGEGRVFVDDALDASRAYAVALEEDLQENVYEALEWLMQGFLDLPGNKLNGGGPDTARLRQIYDNSLYLLYRLLFIFYAESRELLPMHNEAYREHYSLRDLAKEIAGGNVPTSPMTTVNWAKLRQLFQIINGENEGLNQDLGVPRYNGGLFSPELHPFLEEKAVGDRALARAVDLLARRETDRGREYVDYRTLGVRQLGSIYEGLLEYQPRLAQVDMVAVRGGSAGGSKGERWLPASEAPPGANIVERRAAGRVYLATDRGERKATGSYYTPEYIVEYIVENTLGPLLEAIEARATQRYEERAAANTAVTQGLIDEVLTLKCLDPAMGSGHFLVAATDYLAVALATNPFVEIEHTPEEDVVYWKRRVVERCIYGVDRNPLAVELAKLSLWLNTVAADQPLSFLDHHLKCGDSLVGAEVQDLGDAPEAVQDRKRKVAPQQAGLFAYLFSQKLPAIMGRITEIVDTESDSYETVQAKEAADVAVQQLKEPFEAVADLWVSAYFGNAYTAVAYEEARDLIGKPSALLAMPAVQRAREIGKERRFFHWQLAFPEVFYDAAGNYLEEEAGFDAVVGNPPYVRQESLDEVIKKYFSIRFNQVYHGIADVSVYFVGLALHVLRKRGLLGFITSGNFRKLNYGAPLRKFLAEQSMLLKIVEFGTQQVFEGAITYPIILLIQNETAPQSHKVLIIRGAHRTSGGIAYENKRKVFVPSGKSQWNFVGAGLERIVNGWEGSEQLVNFLNGNVNRGITTGLNDAFVISDAERRAIVRKDPGSSTIIKPYIRGEDLHAWYQHDPGLYLIFTRRGIRIDDYPGVKRHLSKYRKRLEPKPAGWDRSKRWPGRKSGIYKWYEIQDSVDYYRIFDEPRIHSTKISLSPAFSFRTTPVYAANTSYVLPSKDQHTSYFLLSLLNSSVSHFYCRSVFAPKANGYYEVQPAELERFPIPSISFTTADDDRARYLEKAQKLYERYCQKDDLACVTGFVKQHLEQEQSDVVHDLLAFLAEQMIAMNKEKQQATEAFWLDLEGVTDGDTFDTLRNKGKWESSLWKDEACRPFVDEESRSTRSLEESLGWNEEAFKAFVKMLAGNVAHLSEVVQVYREHHPRYHDLTDRIARTDYLIDQVVYRLYGLSEEEIAVVEGDD